MKSDLHPKPSAEPAAFGPLAEDNAVGEPLNVLNSLYGTAMAANKYAEAKELYEQNFPSPSPPLEKTTPAEPTISPISPGGRIVPDPSRYVVDRAIQQRTLDPGARVQAMVNDDDGGADGSGGGADGNEPSRSSGS
jgi:hypothetical protein